LLGAGNDAIRKVSE